VLQLIILTYRTLYQRFVEGIFIKYRIQERMSMFHNLRLIDREKSKRSQRVIIYIFDERDKTYPKIQELITNLRTTSRGKHCNLSGLFVVALHLRASDPMRNPRARRIPPYISLDVGDIPRGQIRPKVHYYPCIVLLNIDSIAFE